MIRPFVGVRWWLGVAFAVVAATSTAIVVSQFSDSSEHAFRHNAENAALADARRAAAKGATAANLDRLAKQLNGNVRLRLFGATGAQDILAYTATITVPDGTQYTDHGHSAASVNDFPTEPSFDNFFEQFVSEQATTTPVCNQNDQSDQNQNLNDQGCKNP